MSRRHTTALGTVLGATPLGRYAQLGRRRVDVELVRLWLDLARSPRPLDPEQATAALSADPSVLFLCLGNICRSPFAERYLRNRLVEVGIDDVSIRSAGTMDNPGRGSPAPALEAARAFGVSLDDHESVHVTPELLDASDVIFIMDASNYRSVRQQFGRAVDRTWFLNSFVDPDEYEIADPYGEDTEAFEATYGTIADAVDEFVARLGGGRQ